MDFPGNILTDDTYDFMDIERPVAAPLYQTSLFTFPNVKALREAIQDETKTHLYSRGNNPTVEAVEERMAKLEGGEQAKLFSAGVAAIASSILSCVKQGDHIICANDSYVWAKYICGTYLARFGVSATFVDATNLDEVERAIQKNTKVLYLESPSSMFLRVEDLRSLACLAKSYGITSIVDNTWATPLYQNPLAFGIDLVVHSASKYLGGHSDVVAGVVVGSRVLVERIFKTEFLPIGHVPDPFQAWLIQRGMRTLHVRLPYHYASALSVCDFLYDNSKIEQVHYPMHPKSKWYDLASSQMSGGCGLLSITLKSTDRDKIEESVNRLRHFRIGVSWGGYESLVFPSMASPGANPSMIRLHIGLEKTETLIDDLEQAFSVL
ncbi:PLP-dependent aspartate aminotransferase family protein [uncultured Sphaerochaeta sp.]|uniref:PLP-dependent aspartate aminotransferase family protein n=1 Tax=uncultured Sphaerochaeta sp. TaxID=886478 RepID=UPI002A0A6C4A|nr:PLP-dependent aspartate aminotransferase family protein [uncultured Sphaerochaeta sp.]